MKIWIDLTNSPHINFLNHLSKNEIEWLHVYYYRQRFSQHNDLIKQNGWKC